MRFLSRSCNTATVFSMFNLMIFVHATAMLYEALIPARNSTLETRRKSTVNLPG